MRRHRQFEGSFDGVTAAASWLREAAADAALGAQPTFALEVCLEELLVNVVTHGGPGRSTDGVATPLTIELELAFDAETVEMSIVDNGRSFDVSQAPGKPIKRPLEEIVPGGLGMQLIRSFSSELLYEALPYGNRVIVKLLRHSQPGAKAGV